MPPDDFQKTQQDRRARDQKALSRLNQLTKSKLTLKRPVFFVPGWTDEDCGCRKSPYTKNHTTIKDWFGKVVTNPQEAYYISFIRTESRASKDFFDFGEILKLKIWQTIGKNQDFDVVSHSMGGLDVRAAIVEGDTPLPGCIKCITVATPHWGDHFGGMRYALSQSFLAGLMEMIQPLRGSQAEQGKNLDPDHAPIKKINSLSNRKLFLERIEKLFQLSGSQDFIVKGSAILDAKGVETLYQTKSKKYRVEGSNHTGTVGICQKVGSVALVISLLLDLPVPEDEYNFGNLAGGNYKPGENPERFV